MKRRSGEAVAAQHRKAGPMRHRLAPRGGANNPNYDEEDEDDDMYDTNTLTTIAQATFNFPGRLTVRGALYTQGDGKFMASAILRFEGREWWVNLLIEGRGRTYLWYCDGATKTTTEASVGLDDQHYHTMMAVLAMMAEGRGFYKPA